MDSQFITIITRLDVTMTRLIETVDKLETQVTALQRKQDYWSGAVFAVGALCSVIGAATGLVVQWLFKH
jgi:hypothetical protein